MTHESVNNFYKWELPNDSSFIFVEDYNTIFPCEGDVPTLCTH